METISPAVPTATATPRQALPCYFLLADCAAYVESQDHVARSYRDQAGWTRKSILNTAGTGKFSSDRAIRQHGEEIWGIRPVPVEP